MGDLSDRLAWFKTAILPNRPHLQGRLRRIAPPGYDIDNLVAETLARTYAVADFRAIANGRAYLFSIARNLLIDAARRQTVVAFDFITDLDLLQPDHSTETGLDARDMLRRVQRIVDALPTQCRRVFIRRRVDDWSMTDIAAEMKLSVSTVEKHLTKAIMLVAKGVLEVEEDGFERLHPIPARETRDREQGRGAGRRSP